MALTDLQLLRLRISDKAQTFAEQYYGDALRLIFPLTHYPIISGSQSIYLDNVLQTVTTHYTIDIDLGQITFVTAPGNGAVIDVLGQSAAFSDTELNDILSRNSNDIRRCVMESLEIMLVDGARRRHWGVSNGVSIDETMMVRNVREAMEAIQERQEQEAASSGGFESWASNQQNY